MESFLVWWIFAFCFAEFKKTGEGVKLCGDLIQEVWEVVHKPFDFGRIEAIGIDVPNHVPKASVGIERLTYAR